MKEYLKENKKVLINALISLMIIIIVLLGVLFFYSNKETQLEKFNNTILGMMESIDDIKIDKEYLLIKFPDKKNLITKDGKIKRTSGKKYDQFEKGYILIYKDKSYSFKISNGIYCATKNFNNKDVNVDIYAECENYDVEYK